MNKETKAIEAELIDEMPAELRDVTAKPPKESVSFQGRATDRMLIKAEEDKIKTLEERIETRRKQIKDLQSDIKTCRTRIKLFEKAEAMVRSVTEKKEAPRQT